MPRATLELYLYPHTEASLWLDATFVAVDSSVEAQFAAHVPVAINREALLAKGHEPDAYGRELTHQFFADPRITTAWAKATERAADADLLLRLHLSDALPWLHDLYWETLRNPLTDLPLATDARLHVVRRVASPDLAPLLASDQYGMHALLLVANPHDLGRYPLAPIDVAGEVGRVTQALGTIPLTLIADHAEAMERRATLAALRRGLQRYQPQIVILVSHATQLQGDTRLWLEQEDGRTYHAAATEVVEVLTHADVMPRLVVLLACSSGAGWASLAVQLAQAGLPAVLAMQDLLSFRAAHILLDTFFAALAVDARIDQATTLARAALRDGTEWWVPALWLRSDAPLWLPEPQPLVLPRTSVAPVPSSLGNPFTPGTIVPAERFVGRQDMITTICMDLQTKQSVSVVGEARIGKTSLFYYLRERLPGLLQPYGRYVPIYLTMHVVHDPSTFWHDLLQELLPHLPVEILSDQHRRRLAHDLERDQIPPLDQIKRLLTTIAAAGLSLVLLLDEFKDLLHNPAFGKSFLDELRHLAQQRIIILVVATRQSLIEQENKPSYALNTISAHRRLTRLTPAEARQLLSQPHDTPFDAQDIRRGLRIGANHPYRLQLVGNQLYYAKQQQSKLNARAWKQIEDEVNRTFDAALKLSQTPQRRNWWAWVDALGQSAQQLGSLADTLSTRLLGASILLMIVVLLAYVLGWIDSQTLGDLLRLFRGGS